jgi:hypothetical protein
MWRSTVNLWRSSLDQDEMQAILSTLKRNEELIRLLRPDEIMPIEWIDLLQARLVGDSELESRLRFGMAVYDRALYSHRDEGWRDTVLSTLIPAISLPATEVPILLSHADGNTVTIGTGVGSSPGFDEYDLEDILQMCSRLLFLRSGALPLDGVEKIIQWMLDLPDGVYRRYSFVSYGFASAIAAQPTLLESIPVLNNADLYEVGAPLILSFSHGPRNLRLGALIKKIRRRYYRTEADDDYTPAQLHQMVESILAAYRFEPGSHRKANPVAK